MLGYEFAPHSECGNYKLVVTEKENDEIYLIMMQYNNEPIRFSLNEIQYMDDVIIEYVRSLLPKILSGVYDAKLLEKELD